MKNSLFKGVLVALCSMFVGLSFAQSFYLTSGAEFNRSRWKYTNVVNRKMDGSNFGDIYAGTGIGYAIGFKNEIHQLKRPLVFEVNFMQTTHNMNYSSGVLLGEEFSVFHYRWEDFGAYRYNTYEVRSTLMVGLGYRFLKQNPRWDITASLYYNNSHVYSEEGYERNRGLVQNDFTNEYFDNYTVTYGIDLEHFDADNEFSTHNLGLGVDVNFKFKKEGKFGLIFKAMLMGTDQKLYVFEEAYDHYNPEAGEMERTKLFHSKDVKTKSCNLMLGLSYSL